MYYEIEKENYANGCPCDNDEATTTTMTASTTATNTSETSGDKAILVLSNYYTGSDYPPVVINLEGKFKSGFAWQGTWKFRADAKNLNLCRARNVLNSKKYV